MLASAYGLQYNLPQDGMQGGQGGRPIRGGLEQAPMDFGQENLLDADLYVKEGMTDQYYKKVAALKSFANEVSSKYGYDVTRPNPRDPESIRFHKTYLEGLAGLQRDQNELKRLGKHEDIAIQSPNVQMRNFEDGQTRAVNIGENDMVRALRDTATRVKSREGAEGFKATKELLIEQLTEELAGTQDNRERAELENTLMQIQNINPDVGISDAQQQQFDLQREGMDRADARQARQLAAQAAKPVSGPKPTQAQMDAFGRIKTMADLGNTDDLSSMGLERRDTAEGTYLIKKIGDKEHKVKVDPQNPSSFLNNLNRVLNEDKSTTPVGLDRLQQLEMDLGGFSRRLIGAMEPAVDRSQEVLSWYDRALEEVKNDPTVGQRISQMLAGNATVPPELTNEFSAKGLTGEGKITKIKFNPSEFFGIDRATMNVHITDSNGKKAQKTFNMSTASDQEMMRRIIESNMGNINMETLESVLPSAMTPSASGQPPRGATGQQPVVSGNQLSEDDF
jgi:hypothetical protein